MRTHMMQHGICPLSFGNITQNRHGENIGAQKHHIDRPLQGNPRTVGSAEFSGKFLPPAGLRINIVQPLQYNSRCRKQFPQIGLEQALPRKAQNGTSRFVGVHNGSRRQPNHQNAIIHFVQQLPKCLQFRQTFLQFRVIVFADGIFAESDQLFPEKIRLPVRELLHKSLRSPVCSSTSDSSPYRRLAWQIQQVGGGPFF